MRSCSTIRMVSTPATALLTDAVELMWEESIQMSSSTFASPKPRR